MLSFLQRCRAFFPLSRDPQRVSCQQNRALERHLAGATTLAELESLQRAWDRRHPAL